MKYTAITHKPRGNFQSDFARCEDWVMEVAKDDEVEWSILIYVHTGEPVNKYHRAYGVSSLSNTNVKDEANGANLHNQSRTSVSEVPSTVLLSVCPMCYGLNRTDDDSECPWCDCGEVEVDDEGYWNVSDEWGTYRMKLDNNPV